MSPKHRIYVNQTGRCGIDETIYEYDLNGFNCIKIAIGSSAENIVWICHPHITHGIASLAFDIAIVYDNFPFYIYEEWKLQELATRGKLDSLMRLLFSENSCVSSTLFSMCEWNFMNIFEVDTFQSRLLTHFHIIHIEWIGMRTISFDFKFNKNWVGS